MNVEYIGVDGAKIDSLFTDGEHLAKALNKKLNDEEFFNDFCNTGYVDGKYFYRKFNLFDQSDYKVSLHSLHKNGIVIDFRCVRDTGYNKYNIATSGLLIIKDGLMPTFVVNGIDGQENRDISGKETVWFDVNQDAVKKLIGELGPRIDTPYLVGEKPKDNMITKNYNQKKHSELLNTLYVKLGYLNEYMNTCEVEFGQGRGM